MPDEVSRQAGGAVGTPAGSGGGDAAAITAGIAATPAGSAASATDREPEEGRALAVLAARIQAGDRAAEAELVERFSRGLRLMLRRLAQNAALADDLFQETLALVLEKLRRGEVREPERLAGFIRSTARNLFIADRRKEARYTPLEAPGERAGGESGGGVGGPSGDLPVRGAVGGAGAVGITASGGGAGETTAGGGGAPAALAAAMAKQEAEQVRRLLGEMRYERDRQVLIRFYLLDDDRESVCAHLGIEPERFNQVLHRARERLRELWERAEKRQRFFSAVRGIVGRVGEDPSP
jgi:RNA polymerase sigma-70 factor (ECF subfamily)